MPSYKDLNIDYKFGMLDLNYKNLRSLEGCPNHIAGVFRCSHNDLTSLVGGPQIVEDDYYCTSNKLTDFVGCASHIGETLYLYDNHITSLVGIHKIIKSCKRIRVNIDKITEGGIGLLLIDNLIDVSINTEPFEIISKYIGTGTKGMMACRKELISKGYTEYAKL